MIQAELPIEELERVHVLKRYEIMDTEEEACFDDLVKVASKLCNTPISLISLLDHEFNCFKSSIGLPGDTVKRQYNICGHAILQPDVFVVEDTTQDERYSQHPIVSGNLNVRFYAGVPLKSSAGHHLGTLCVLDFEPRVMEPDQIDVLKILAHQVVSQIELRQYQREMQLNNEKLKEINVSKDKMFSIIAHDLRAPFHGIMGFSEVLETEIETLDEKGIRDIAGYLRSTAHATFRLLENLLQWAMTEGDMMVYRPKQIYVEQVFQSVCDILGAVAQKKNIMVHCLANPSLSIQADINMMNSLLQNLMSNALKFTTNGGHIYLSAYEIDQQVYISVRDTGIGMTDEQIQNFLDRKPPKSYNGTDGEKGSGLGLILCRQFAERNNGVIKLESILDQGTTFTIILPSAIRAS